MKRCTRPALAAALALFAAACGGGGSGNGGAQANLAGHWKVWLGMSGQEFGPFPVCLTQNGTVIDGANLNGTVNGSSFTVTSPAFLGLGLQLTGSQSGATAQGSFVITGSAVSGSFRMESYQPDGSLTLDGTVETVPVSVAATTAVGVREYSDQGLTTLKEIELSFGDGTIFLELAFAPSLAVGTYSIGSGVDVEVGYVSDLEQHEVSATGGTVTVSRFDNAGMAGTFTVLMAGGNSLTGTFDVDWEFDAYEP